MLFSELAVAYLFFGGAGAGTCAVMGVLECANLGRYGTRATYRTTKKSQPRLIRWVRRNLRVPHELLSRGWVLCLMLLAVGSLCLMADAGRPERVLSLWLAPRFTVVTVGAWALLASGALATFFALASNGIGARLPLFVVLVASVAAVIAGVVTAVYTGMLLMQLPSVVAFGSWLVPALFCLSSLSCGVAVAFGVASFVDSRVPFGSALRCLSHMDRAIIIAEAVALALFATFLLTDIRTEVGGRALLTGDEAIMFWVVLVLAGLVAPFILECRYPGGDRRTKGLWIAVCVLLGGAALRVCVTGLASFDVSQNPELAMRMAFAVAGG